MKKLYFPLFLSLTFGAAGLLADVRLPAIVSDHMLVQQAAPVRIWGQADPGEGVRVEFQGQKVSAKADAAGKWMVFLAPLKAGGPAEMTIAGNNTITIHDVLVGDVWIGSGQSNMEMGMSRVNNAEQEIAAANFPEIRLFTVKKKVSETPLDDVEGAWSPCTPESVKNFSAVGYFFSRDLYQAWITGRTHVPIGFIHTSWGGTPAQSWTSHPALEAEPALKFILDDWQKTLDTHPANKERFDQQLAKWKEEAAAARADNKPAPPAPRPPQGPGHQNTPAGLYNAMIAPITPYTIRGATWYQGEANANAGHAYAYRRLFRLMIEDWRQAWGIGDFPFLFVQLANFKSNPYWPLLRESQTDTLGLRNTGMAVIIDIGESKDIHPKNKQDVGHRLALAARATVYGEKIEYSGPMFRTLTSEGDKLRVWFDHTGRGLEARGGALTGFTIAGKDGNFVPADAKIDGKTVVVSCASVPEPVAVRYAWEDDPVSNLINAEGLPASGFRAGAGQSGPIR
jgi:sialate O-acetylesterase